MKRYILLAPFWVLAIVQYPRWKPETDLARFLPGKAFVVCEGREPKAMRPLVRAFTIRGGEAKPPYPLFQEESNHEKAK